MRVDNPFYHRGAIRQPEHFFGRDAIIDEVYTLLRNGQSVSVVGPRRIGKSSLLMHMCHPTVRANRRISNEMALLVLVDCQALGGSPPEEVYSYLLDALQHASNEAGYKIETGEPTGTYRALDRALYQLSRQTNHVVFLLDEFELLAANTFLTPYFFARLRGLTTKYGLAYLTASQRPLFAITAEEEILSSPFFNIFVTLPLGLFSQDEARRLLESRLANGSIQFTGELINYLVYLSGPHPYFLHIAGYHAYRQIKQDDLPQGPDTYHLLDAPIEVEAASQLGYLWQNLTGEEQYALAIADGPVDTMRMLEQQCLLSLQDQRYRYTSEILRRFVRRQDVPELIQSGPFVIDRQRHQVWAMGDEMNLTNSQFRILSRLCENPAQVVRSDDLERSVWGEALVNDPDRLKTLIKRLRQAIDPYQTWIVSERGVGYVLRQPE